MRSKPKGTKYRNLVARDGVIYYRREVGGRQVRVSLDTDDWSVAAHLRDEVERGTDFATKRSAIPTFGEVADDYLRLGLQGYAASTVDDRSKHLQPGKPLYEFFGDQLIDQIDRATIQRFWDEGVTKRGLAKATGDNYLNSLSAVLAFAEERGLVTLNAAEEFYRVRKRGRRTKSARAEKEEPRHPIEDGDHVRALVEAADEYRRESQTTSRGRGKQGLRSLRDGEVHAREQAYVALLLMLDAGLRLGEAIGGVRWSDLHLDDQDPYLVVAMSLSRGKFLGTPKSGRSREVAVSQRLKRALLESRAKCGSLGDGPVITIDPANFRNRAWPWIRRRAKLPTVDGREHKPKDLRDTYASHLLTAGIPLPYVSFQLGHAQTTTTDTRYARWIPRRRYVPPPALASGEVPADLLARLGRREKAVTPGRHTSRTEAGEAGLIKTRSL